jgi:hypothetical protein
MISLQAKRNRQVRVSSVNEGNTACVPEHGIPEISVERSGSAPELYVFDTFITDETDLPAFAPPAPSFPPSNIDTPTQSGRQPAGVLGGTPSGKLGNFERIFPIPQ